MRLPDTVTARVVSCDVFDTLLHRDHRSENRRFGDIAALAARRLAHEHRIERHPAEIWRARITVQRSAYRALDLSYPTGDVRFADMVDAMAQVLGLSRAAAPILHEAEIAVERAQLSANGPLLAWLAAQARAGCRVIAISDTYHEAGTIADLLTGLAPRHPVGRVHTSADHNATKRMGSLFGAVLRAEGLAPAEVLHIGDDHRADVAMARAAGLQALQLSRPGHLLVRRRADAVRCRLTQAFRASARRSRGARSSPA